MKTRTAIIDSQGKGVVFREVISYGGNHTYINLFNEANQRIGYLARSQESGFISVDSLHNFTIHRINRCKYIGTYLLNYHAFLTSLENSKYGLLQLISSGDSPLFYLKFGFMPMLIHASNFQYIFQDYFLTREEKSKHLLLKCYQELKNLISENSNIIPDELMFEDVINPDNWIDQKTTNLLEQLHISNKYKINEDGYVQLSPNSTPLFLAGNMFLPSSSINKKLVELGLEEQYKNWQIKERAEYLSYWQPLKELLVEVGFREKFLINSAKKENYVLANKVDSPSFKF